VALYYRARQFWDALKTSPTAEDLDQARKTLTPTLMELFLQMDAGEQVHSIRVFKKLSKTNDNPPDLLAAALLHDVGKSRYPLRLWERVLVVVGQVLFPEKAKDWGKSEPLGWKRAFVVADRHTDWGAELALGAGATPLTASLFRRHHDRIIRQISQEDGLLIRLQSVDNES
jgi:hypothetical protein